MKGKYKLIGGSYRSESYEFEAPDLRAHVDHLLANTRFLWLRKDDKLVKNVKNCKLNKNCSCSFALKEGGAWVVHEQNFGKRGKKSIPMDIAFHDGNAFKQLKRLAKLRPKPKLIEFLNGPVALLNKKATDEDTMAVLEGRKPDLRMRHEVNEQTKAFLRAIKLS
jgi:hypothetical protein